MLGYDAFVGEISEPTSPLFRVKTIPPECLRRMSSFDFAVSWPGVNQRSCRRRRTVVCASLVQVVGVTDILRLLPHHTPPAKQHDAVFEDV